MRIVFFVLALLALAFWGFGVFDMWATLSSWPPYVEQYGADMFAWIQGFPVWRKTIWGASLGFGLIGSLLLFARDRLSGPALLTAWLLMAGGFGYDLAFQDGARNYGQGGLIASGVLVALAAVFAWVGFASVGRARTRRPLMAVAPALVASEAQAEPVAIASASGETAPPAQQSESPTSEPAPTLEDSFEPEPPVAESAPPARGAPPSQVDAEEPGSPADESEPTAQTPSEDLSPMQHATEDDEPAAPASPEDKPTAG